MPIIAAFPSPPPIADRYSTDQEYEVGIWIDGRTIYRRTFTWTSSSLPSNKWSYYRGDDLIACNIDQFIDIRGLAYCTSSDTKVPQAWQPIPRVCPDALAYYSIGFGDLSAGQIGILFGTNYTAATIHVTVDFVKVESS